MVKNLLANSGDAGRDMGSVPESGRSLGEGNENIFQYSCLENFHRQGLAGYSPWGCKESDTTQRLALHFTSTLLVHFSVEGL